MFIKSKTSSTPDIFNSFVQNLKGSRLSKFNDNKSWHNVFRYQITWQINEGKFEVLFSKDMGRPNSPIRMLIGMMILKEGFGWSDEQLFEECQFNILVMGSLGLSNIDDSMPSPATYYNFRKSLYKHQVTTGVDLIGLEFQELTFKQAGIFGVTGLNERMDSVLFGSNIAKSSRLQLIINVIQEFYKDISSPRLLKRLNKEDIEMLKKINQKKGGQIVYQLNSDEREKMIESLGYLLYRITNAYSEKESEKYRLITRVLGEQYRIEGDKVMLKKAKELKADSLQSPYDEDAEYRNKNGEKVQGYSGNITETCNENGLNLITDIQVEGATTPDTEFVKPGIENSKKIIQSVEHLNTDGAYHSTDNQVFIEEEEIEWILSGIQGKKGEFEFKLDDNQELLAVISILTGEINIPIKTKSGKYRITINGRHRYFSKKEIESYLQRQKVDAIPQKEKNRRNNVEATVFQLVWPLRNKKTKYKGKFKNQLWAFLRCLWINFVRIKNYMGELCPVSEKSGKCSVLLTFFSELSTKSFAWASFQNNLNFYLKMNDKVKSVSCYNFLKTDFL